MINGNNNNIDNDSTQFDAVVNNNVQSRTDELEVAEVTVESAEPAPKSKGAWKKIAVGGVSGLVLGSATAALSSFTSASNADAIAVPEDDNEGSTHESGHPLVDSAVDMADTVSEDMSFSQAFASARAEVGPGGAFEWHGNIYSTYYAEEWDHMSAAERAEYNDHFAWNHHSTSHHDGTEHYYAQNTVSHHDSQSSSDEIAQETTGQHEGQDDNGGSTSYVSGSDEPEVQVLGVVHDADTGTNIGAMMIDDQEIVLIDLDNDHTFDIMASDLDHDNELSDNEIFDISDQNITVDDLGGFNDPTGDYLADDTTGSEDYYV